jgi:hypothetical protein
MKNEQTAKRTNLSKKETIILIAAGTGLAIWLYFAVIEILIPKI